MNNNNVGISQKTLVSNIENDNVPAKRLPQYVASLSSTLGALAVGMVLSWTSSTGIGGKALQDVYAIEISFTVGWLLIIFANSVLMFYIGRFIAGFSAGAFCVAARELSIISAIVPFIFFGIFVFMPESPTFYIQKGDEDSLLSVCVFITVFNIGFGPLPWMMLGEIFAPEIKGIAASTAGLLNWLIAFVVTKFYNDLRIAIDIGPTFWLFSLMSGMGGFFVYFLVPLSNILCTTLKT